MTTAAHSPLVRHFLNHQPWWIIGLLFTWAVLNVLVLATSVIMEDGRAGSSLPMWEPFCWETTSVATILVLFPLINTVSERYLVKLSLGKQILAHLAMTVPFSVLHVSGMVVLRKLWYWLANSQYHFGNVPFEFLYEYRKDFQTYLTVVLVIAGYRFVVRRLHGEASVVHEGEQVQPKVEKPTERLLVKKLGKEFLVNVKDIEWVEAAGNYANLHIGNSLYPMRITMAKLERTLANQDFARIHRSYIVNLNKVKTIVPLETGDYELTLVDGKQLSLSRRYREAFKQLAA